MGVVPKTGLAARVRARDLLVKAFGVARACEPGGRYTCFFSSRRRHTRCSRDWSSDVCSSDLVKQDNRQEYYCYDGHQPECGLGRGGILYGQAQIRAQAGYHYAWVKNAEYRQDDESNRQA